MRRATPLLLLALAATSLLQGCFTRELWSKLDGPLDITPAEVTSWTRSGGEGFRVAVRYSDGSERVVTVVDAPGMPAELLRVSHRMSREPDAAARVLLAVKRGLVSRAFATDRDLAHLAGEPDFQAAAIAPVVSPTFSLCPPGVLGSRHLLLRGEDGVDVEAASLDAEASDPSAGVVTAVVLATPLTFAVDVATSPFQAVFLLFGLAVGSAL